MEKQRILSRSNVFSSFLSVVLFCLFIILIEVSVKSFSGNSKQNTNLNSEQNTEVLKSTEENIKLAENLPETGEPITSFSYTDSKYGFSFLYPSNMEKTSCDDSDSDAICLKEDGVLRIQAYKSLYSLDFDYDVGVDETLFTPERIMVGPARYYLVTDQDNNISHIGSDVVLVDELLWIKQEKKVANAKGSYYVSFFIDEEFDKQNLPDLNIIFGSFKF
ncbi:MAG: hypothetical protein PHS44_06280 [Candidatus Dojkabacteria bacterium]|nr:hypothetical protein [Candidatus Dojkabacteria bacterium]